jgi:hypothetical protein
VDAFENNDPALILLSVLDLAASIHTSDGQKEHYAGHENAEWCVPVVFDLSHLPPAVKAVKESGHDDERACESVNPHVRLPVVLHVPIRDDLYQRKDGPDGPQRNTVNQKERRRLRIIQIKH